MSLSTRLSTSYELFVRSLQVLRGHPRLLIFPAVTIVFTVLLVGFFLTPIVLLLIETHEAGGNWDEAVERFRAAFYAYGAVIYLVTMVLATFFNVAFYHEIIRALAGEEPSVRGGFRFAWSRVRAVVMWGLLAATVGLVIRLIEERLGLIGKWVMALIGAVWSVAAVFAIPVIIRREDANPIAVLRDSASTLKRTWGESLTGYVGIQMIGLAILLFLAATVGLGLYMATFTGLAWLGGLVVVFGLAIGIAASLALSMAGHIYRCALYVYASEGVVPGAYTADHMNAGWKVKKS